MRLSSEVRPASVEDAVRIHGPGAAPTRVAMSMPDVASLALGIESSPLDCWQPVRQLRAAHFVN